ncbi:MAG: transglycosylase SLT domain-containing protein [Acetobacteraceae bacterium]|nr:transglycosylase SLT domain-containing protein [Acetobacteraceae bacterium]
MALPPPPPGLQCRQAITAAERAAAVPPQLMAAIARVESGRADARGAVHPWPWTINAEGTGQYFETKAAALAAVRTLQARGVRSIDVGCMQVNLYHHPAAFASLEQAFDPAANAAYAARYLTELYATTRDWTRATAFYHSATPERGEFYQRRVAAIWPEEQRRGGVGLGLHQANAFTSNAFSRNAWNTAGRPASGPLARSGRPVSRSRF